MVGVAIKWLGQGTEEIGVDITTNRVLVRIDPKYFRPAEVDQLLGDPAKAEKLLGWKRTIGFDDLVREMVSRESGEGAVLICRCCLMSRLRGTWSRIIISLSAAASPEGIHCEEVNHL